MSAVTELLDLMSECRDDESEQARIERLAVRAFLAHAVSSGLMTAECDSWMSGFDPDFSRELGARGWIGMTWPARYGGRDRTPEARFAVIEELLAAGAPIAAHWFADRQVGPSLLKHGTEEQRAAFLPSMARGELFFCIGMSEPEAGSDLGAVSTRARGVEGGWSVSGQKVWTSHAAEAHHMLALVRTGSREEPAAQALTQVIIDMSAPGVTVRPIPMMDGRADFCEVFLDDVFVPDHRVVGRVGRGWHQVLSELVYERSGPERFLSTLPMLAAWVESGDADDGVATEALGELVGRLVTLRAMSARVNARGDGSRVSGVAAALVKDLGTRTELDSIRIVEESMTPTAGDAIRHHLAVSRTHSPGFTLRGGTSEILSGIIARAVLPR